VVAPSLSPDPDQRRVLDHEDGSLLVTGGPGTGKSAVLRERFARLVEEGADPERVVLVVGSRRAREAARAGLLERLPASLPGLRVLTIHGLAHHVLRERHSALGYDEPPEILSAADQFAKVQELLEGQDPADWPAYGALLGLRGFADEVRQFLLRAQEALRTPEQIEEAAEGRSLTGWAELARFYREYLQVMDGLNVVDFAMLLQRAGTAAAAGPPLLDHLLIDDFQDTTLAAEALVHGVGVADLLVAGDPGAHVFSFQGTTSEPIQRFVERTPGATTVELTICHRAPEPLSIDAWVAPQTSEEHAAIARELRRRHVEDGVSWSDLAVVLRRQGSHLGGLLRALDDARVPRAVPERGLSLTAEPATFPYVLALRWLVADLAKREELIEPLLTSDVVGLSAATARGLLRVARAVRGSISEALDVTETLTVEEASTLTAARDALAKAALFAGMSVQDAFRVLWEDLPCSRRLVARGSAKGTSLPGSDAAEARRQLDTVVTFANVVAEAGGGADGSVAAFLEALDAGEHGPGYSAWERARPDAVQVLTAHGASGQEFDTVIVAGATEGNFPSLTRPEPMFDLGVLNRQVTRSERTRERLEDERRLFRMVLGRARRRVILSVSEEHPEEDALTTRTRFADEAGAKWVPAPEGPFDDPVSVREASATWRRELADLKAPATLRLAALEGLLALGVNPHRWWFHRDWTDPGRRLDEDLRVSFSKLSKLDNCELQHVLSDELGLGTQAGYQAWVGKLVHKIIEDCETGALGRTQAEILTAVDERWREQEFPSKAVSAAYRRLVEDTFLPNWWFNYGETRSLAVEQQFAFEYDGVTINGVIDRIGPILSGGTRITDFKTGKPENGPKAEESLQLGIYYLAVQECEELAAFRPVRSVELAYLKGHWKTGDIILKAWQVNARSEEAYQAGVRTELSRLLGEKKRLNDAEIYRPRPEADCFFCDFKTLCPLYPEGATPLQPQGVAS